MPPGPKRNDNMYEEPAATMAARAPTQAQAFVPTPETQEMYNKMRQEEEKPSLEFLRQQTSLGGFLQPPSPSQATATSPSPSHASATRSVTRALNDMNVGGEQPQNKRAGRNGPLSEAQRLRTALMRKLGACDACRGRRVKCNHRDFSAFEAAYQQAKQAADQPLDPDPSPDLRSPGPSPYQPRFSDSHDLRGVGVGQQNAMSFPPQGPPDGRDEAHEDHDVLSECSQDHQAAVAPGPQSALIFGGSRHAILNPFLPYSADNPSQNTSAGGGISIGKQVILAGQGWWDCLWGSMDAGSSTPFGVAEPCTSRFRTLEDLEIHFAACHTPFHRPWFMWRCVACDFQSPSLDHICRHCSRYTLQQMWYWAEISNSSRSTSGFPGWVATEDGSPSSRTSWTSPSWTSPSVQYFGQTGGYPSTFSFGGYGNGHGAGQYRSAAQATASERVRHFGARCPKSPSSARISCHRPDKGAWYTAFPWVVAGFSLFFTLVLVEIWPSAGRSCVGRHVLSCIIDNCLLTITELSIGCVVVGLVASWLFRHARFRLSQQSEHVEAQRCVMRDVFGIPRAEDDGRVGIVAG